MIRSSRIAMFAVTALMFSSVAVGQNPAPDPLLWGGGVTNPSGDTAVPAVVYDYVSGLMYVDTAGLNRVVDTTSGTLIGGDDVGMLSLRVEGPPANDVLLDGFVPSIYGGGVIWNSTYSGGEQVLSGIGIYLDPALRTDIFVYDAGLTPADFDVVEMFVTFEPGPGATMFGSVQFVPEPASLSMLGAAFLALVGLLRLR